MKNSNGLLIAAAVALMGVTGCATKNYVKSQTAPIIDHTNQLDQKSADNNRALHDADDRATAGIKQAQGSADSAAQNAQNATKAAGDADTAANDAVHRADSLASHRNLATYELIRQKLAEIPVETMRPVPLVTGDDLIAAGHSPGPKFREILTAVEDAQLEGRLASRDAALEFVRREFPV